MPGARGLGCRGNCWSPCSPKSWDASARPFPPGGTSWGASGQGSRWREFQFALHQLQQAIAPPLELDYVVRHWNEIARALAEGIANGVLSLRDIIYYLSAYEGLPYACPTK
jgi:hypothetical protein